MSTRPRVNTLKMAMAGMQAVDTAPALYPVPTQAAAQATPQPPSRIGKRVISAYIAPDAAKQMRLLAADLDRSTQSLVEEALNDLFRKYGRSAIA